MFLLDLIGCLWNCSMSCNEVEAGGVDCGLVLNFHAGFHPVPITMHVGWNVGLCVLLGHP